MIDADVDLTAAFFPWHFPFILIQMGNINFMR
jgi:hypothetical protein